MGGEPATATTCWAQRTNASYCLALSRRRRGPKPSSSSSLPLPSAQALAFARGDVVDRGVALMPASACRGTPPPLSGDMGRAAGRAGRPAETRPALDVRTRAAVEGLALVRITAEERPMLSENAGALTILTAPFCASAPSLRRLCRSEGRVARGGGAEGDRRPPGDGERLSILPTPGAFRLSTLSDCTLVRPGELAGDLWVPGWPSPPAPDVPDVPAVVATEARAAAASRRAAEAC
mmetsp:Transcript_64220/g.139713  ORF Transcript_64220/g.139713 Transcript_64220/m.139713 type:complete len:236 (+) Transcript_64220:218-925(+)